MIEFRVNVVPFAALAIGSAQGNHVMTASCLDRVLRNYVLICGNIDSHTEQSVLTGVEACAQSLNYQAPIINQEHRCAAVFTHHGPDHYQPGDTILPYICNSFQVADVHRSAVAILKEAVDQAFHRENRMCTIEPLRYPVYTLTIFSRDPWSAMNDIKEYSGIDLLPNTDAVNTHRYDYDPHKSTVHKNVVIDCHTIDLYLNSHPIDDLILLADGDIRRGESFIYELCRDLSLSMWYTYQDYAGCPMPCSFMAVQFLYDALRTGWALAVNDMKVRRRIDPRRAPAVWPR